MLRAEFLANLTALLQDIPAEDREDAIKYYNEYLDEAGPENAANAIRELGGAEKVSNLIHANLGLPVTRVKQAEPAVPELTLDGPQYKTAEPQTGSAQTAPPHEEPAAQPHAEPPASTSAEAQYARYAQQAASGVKSGVNYAQTKWNNTNRNNRIAIVILILVALPFLTTIFGFVVSVFATIFGIVLAFSLSGILFAISGIVLVCASLPLLSTAFADSLMNIAAGLGAVGLGILLTGLFLKFLFWIAPIFWRNMCKWVTVLKRKVVG